MVGERVETGYRKPNLSYTRGEKVIWPRSLQEGNGRTLQDDVEITGLVDQYLIEIGRYPLLTVSCEKVLTQKIKIGQKAWNYLAIFSGFENLEKDFKTSILKTLKEGKKIVDFGNLTWDQYVIEPPGKDIAEEKIEQLKEACEAFNKLVNSNLRLVVTVAKSYQNKGLSFIDLIQEGNIGLMRAATKFEPQFGNKFSTYATWWIRQAVQRAIGDKSRAIRLPTYLNDRRAEIGKTSDTLSQELQREPTYVEIAKSMGLSVKQVSAALSPRDTLSLETEIGKDGKSELTDVIPDPNQDVVEAATKDELKAKVTEVLDCLKLREGKVISLRFGLADGRSRNLEQVAEALKGLGYKKVTRERIRQIEAKALGKLRQSPKAQRLAIFLN